MRDIYYEKHEASSQLEPSQTALHSSTITELERRIIRLKSACLSSFSRPIDSENLINAQSELAHLRLQRRAT